MHLSELLTSTLLRKSVFSEQNVICGICACLTHSWVDAGHLITSKTSGIGDTFKTPYVCTDCELVWGEARLLFSGGFIATPESVFKPLARADGERPAWNHLLRTLAVGTECVSVITTNTKRRLWPRAVVSRYNDYWRPLFVEGHVDRLLTIRRDDMLDCLDLVETVYRLGFSKESISTSLFSTNAYKVILSVGLAKTNELESALTTWRMTDAFPVSVFVAQKE
jgi:hypothetical protein